MLPRMRKMSFLISVMVCMALQTTQEHLKGLGKIVQEQERRIRDLETAR